jgi:hypothetical protein
MAKYHSGTDDVLSFTYGSNRKQMIACASSVFVEKIYIRGKV